MFSEFEEMVVLGLEEIKNIQLENEADFHTKLKSEAQLLDLLLVEHLALLSTLSPFFSLKTRSFKGLKAKTTEFEIIRTFTWLLNNSINNLLSLRVLLSMGMDLQARVLFRNYIESMDVSVAILLSLDFYEKYRKECDNEKEAKIRWHGIKTSSLLKTIQRELDKDEKLNQLWQIGFEMRSDNYSRASKGVHVEPIAVIYNSYPSKLDTTEVVQNIGGVITNATKSTILSTYYYGGFIINFLKELLQTRSKLGPLAVLNKNGRHYATINKVNQHLWLITCFRENEEKLK